MLAKETEVHQQAKSGAITRCVIDRGASCAARGVPVALAQIKYVSDRVNRPDIYFDDVA